MGRPNKEGLVERQREMGSMDEDGANRLVEGGVEDAYKLGEAVDDANKPAYTPLLLLLL